MYSSRTKRLLKLALERQEQLSSSSSDEDPFPGTDDLSDDPNYSPSDDTTDEFSDSVEVQPSKRPRVSQSVSRSEVENAPSTSRQQSHPSDNMGSDISDVGPSERQVESAPSSSDRQSEPFDIVWSNPQNRSKTFTFNLAPSIDPELAADLVDKPPIDFFKLLLTDEILDMMVTETNRYAEQIIIDGIVSETIGPSSRLHKWKPTDRSELLKFLGLIGYMGLMWCGDYKKYWNTRYIYKNSVVPTAMSRNRFEILMRMWHFSDNEKLVADDRLCKLRPLVVKLQERYTSVCTPGETICVDESMIPFRGRLLIKQYIPNKAHKYGVKIFKLCCNKGYTWNFKIYEGREKEKGGSVPTNIVMDLAEKLLDGGRTIITDNYYTSYDLAKKLLNKKTHLVGTLRKNRKRIPKEVVNAKLRRGESIARECQEGIMVLKWKDKRDVLTLSTKHGPENIEINTRRGVKTKPQVIVDYNEGKAHIDLSDQMSTYNSSLRKNLKWYKKIAIELIFGTSLVNGHILYKNVTKKDMSVTCFKEEIVEFLLLQSDIPAVERPLPQQALRRRHSLVRKEGDNRKVRRGCQGCKQKKIEGKITKNQIKKIVTFCPSCPGEPFYCLPCYNENHS